MQTQSQFLCLAEQLFEKIASCFESLPGYDVELNQDSLSVTLPDQNDRYLLTCHSTLKQVWLTSPFGGAYHFSYDPVRKIWADVRSSEELMTFLITDLPPLLSKTFEEVIKTL